MISRHFVCLLSVAALSLLTVIGSAAEKPPNVLFIAIDDLNDWVGHLGGNAQAKTPNIDKLAARGVTFQLAHCAAPVCNPSRTALMSGLRPSTTGVYDNGTDWRKVLPEAVTLPLHFREQGYYVAGAGKLYHEAFRRRTDWSDYLDKSGGDPKPKGKDGGVGGIKFAPLDCDDADMADYRSVSYIVEQLNKPHEKPFFLACGLYKPHMPWNVPRKYYEMHPLETIVLPKVLDTDLDDVPAAGRKMAAADGDHKTMVESGRWKEAVQAYLAAGSFADAMVGRLIEGLDKSPHKDNTIVVLWGDHGWHLGEKRHWRKFTLWEEATRAPLLFVAPGVTRPNGVCRRTVDFMSIYPTLCELCDLPIPKHVEGKSVKKLLLDPSAPWYEPALTTHGFGNHALRSEAWRFIQYADGSEELYDERRDPQEWTNLAGEEKYNPVTAEFKQMLPKVNVRPPARDKRNDSVKPQAKKTPD